MHIEDLIFSFNGKIIAERKSNLASCTHAWHCSYLLGAALNYIFHGLNYTSPSVAKCRGSWVVGKGRGCGCG